MFQTLDKGETVKETKHLLVAPNCLQNKVLAMIDEEIHHAKAGEEAYIGLKMNSLTDKKIIEKFLGIQWCIFTGIHQMIEIGRAHV